MTKEQNISSSASAYLNGFLEDHFDEKPATVNVLFHPPFLLFHLEGFLLPSEKMLLEKGERNHVLKTRDLLWNSLEDSLLEGLQEIHGVMPTDLYTDWNLEKGSGLLLVILESETPADVLPWPEEADEEAIREIITMNSVMSQKRPQSTDFFWLTPGVLLVKRSKIFVDIEKQLIENGITEELRLAKRPLEQRVRKLFNLDHFLPAPVEELFVDWNFPEDLSYLVLILGNPQSR